jgi:hypothetical protein
MRQQVRVSRHDEGSLPSMMQGDGDDIMPTLFFELNDTVASPAAFLSRLAHHPLSMTALFCD